MLTIILLFRYFSRHPEEWKKQSRRLKNQFSFFAAGKRKVILLILLAVVVCCLNSAAQQMRFRVVRNDEVIGHVLANQVKQQEITSISIESLTKIKLLWGFSINIKQADTFSNGLLTAAYFNKVINNKEKLCHRMQWCRSFYHVRRKGDEDLRQPQPVYYTTSSLYFTEPVNITDVYSPNFLAFGKMRKVAINKYELQLPDGNKNYYSYKNGICEKVEVNTDWATVFFINEKF